ncbi:hypothetical protein C1H76_2013 [Elsinoe australis]|uniref:Uncharacterized protein n=1 Tax=Elsinoe australis TaxID=40998 RepID=A0A4U7BBP2_9PEZI|nr:hypothetical protein C1H76_2013 [Elsinoe australis]
MVLRRIHNAINPILHDPRTAETLQEDPDTTTPPTSPSWPHRPDDTLPAIAQQAISVLLLSTDQSSGQISGLGYWQTANAYTAIALHDLWSTSSHVPSPPNHPHNIPLIHNNLRTILSRNPHCINNFNDDTLWYAHLLLLLSAPSSRLPSAVGSNDYLIHCHEIHKHISRFVLPPGSRDVQGRDVSASVLWKSDNDCKEVNSITTSLWAEFCARLAYAASSQETEARGEEGRDAAREGGREGGRAVGLVEQAMGSLDFVFRCLYDREEDVVYDTLKLETGEVVRWCFSYTTGQTIAGCVAVHEAVSKLTLKSGEEKTRAGEERKRKADELLGLAMAMARQAVRRKDWVQDGVVVEYGAYGPENHKAWENDDAVGFKSVLVRSLAKLWKYLRKLEGDVEVEGVGAREMVELREDIERVVRTTYDSLQANCTNGIGQWGPWWAGPMDMSTCHSQMAVLDVMAVMRLMNG